MQRNLPVTQRAYDFADHLLLVSTTDLQGRITHCNQAFAEVSGYRYEELIGQPHNMIRHPDMPAEAFRDLWSTIGHGRPWSGIVKNRRQDGDHYWVRAHVVPVMDGGRPVAYMSVRLKPGADEVLQAEALYAALSAARSSGRPGVRLHAGRVRYTGWRDLPGRIHRANLTHRLAAALGATAVGAAAASAAGPHWTLAALLTGSVLTLIWFQRSVQRRLDQAESLAIDLSSCNLRTAVHLVHPHPLSGLLRALFQIQLNLKAVIGDARMEVDGTAEAIRSIAIGSQDLADRTLAETESIQQTAEAMQAVVSSMDRTAGTAGDVAARSLQTAQAAAAGGRDMHDVAQTVQTIESASRQVASIVQIIEGLAFQTNILAINAAVEAARAGPQGRGFAVVAGEVRALAQRSAESAQDIRDLIDQSVEAVSNGSRQIAATASSIQHTVAEVEVLGQLVDGIRHETGTRRQELLEIGRAVDDLDRSTQDNSGLVQQAALAVETLERRTSTLTRSVQVFRL